jgi:ribonuclease P protein component
VWRLKTHAQYQAVLAVEPLSKSAHFVIHRANIEVSRQTPMPGVGAMVPKRWAKRAVTRNLIKRQIYIAASQHEAMLRPHAHVVRLRTSFDSAKFISASSDRLKQEVRAEIEGLFKVVCAGDSE